MVSCPRSARNAKWIDDAQTFFERHAVLHVLRPQRIAARVKRRGGDHGVVSRKAIPLRELQSRFVHLESKRMNRQQAAQHVQKCMRIGPGHLHLPARDVGEFVENLNADRTAGGDSRFRPIGLCCIA